MFLAKGESLVFAGFVQVTSKLYANSFLGSLNMRTFLRDSPHATTAYTLSAPSGRVPTSTAFSHVTSRHIEIYQRTSKSAFVDEHDDIDILNHHDPQFRAVTSRTSMGRPEPQP